MRIIDEQPFAYEFECERCGSKLVAEAEDVEVGYFGPNYGGETPRREYYVSCAVCKTNRILKPGELTPKVREMADAKEQ